MWSALDNDNNEVSDEVMERYKHMVAATEYTSLSRMGYENCIIEGMKPFTPGRKLVSARACYGTFQSGRTWWPRYEGESREGRELGAIVFRGTSRRV